MFCLFGKLIVLYGFEEIIKFRVLIFLYFNNIIFIFIFLEMLINEYGVKRNID